jgi:hypothetical protein
MLLERLPEVQALSADDRLPAHIHEPSMRRK